MDEYRLNSTCEKCEKQKLVVFVRKMRSALRYHRVQSQNSESYMIQTGNQRNVHTREVCILCDYIPDRERETIQTEEAELERLMELIDPDDRLSYPDYRASKLTSFQVEAEFYLWLLKKKTCETMSGDLVHPNPYIREEAKRRKSLENNEKNI